MNTRNARNAFIGRRNGAAGASQRAPLGRGRIGPAVSLPKRHPVSQAEAVIPGPTHFSPTREGRPIRSAEHALVDLKANAYLACCEDKVKGRFDAIVPTLKRIAAIQHEADFVPRAQAMAQEALGFELPTRLLDESWVAGLDMRVVYAECIFNALKASVAQFAEEIRAQAENELDARNFFLECGFHAVDVTPCADGRLKGLMQYILRLPLTALRSRKAYAGALFDVEANVKHWMATELARFREGQPTTADANTRYLKVVVYHYSSSDPNHAGCAAHGSNVKQAMEEGLKRLKEFRQAIENSFCCGASVDILLIGVDTDTDAIRIHPPDGKGNLSPYRFVDNAELYQTTIGLNEDQARLAVYEALRKASAATGWGTGQGEPHEGMRRFMVNLLILNLSQIAYVKERYGDRYPDIGHAERFISIGDGFEEVQMRNVAYYAHLHTVEEGAPDLDVGVRIFQKLNIARGLPILIAIHYRYDAKVPGSCERTAAKCRRVKAAVEARYPDLMARGLLFCRMSIQDRPMGSPLEVLEEVSP
jgi:carboxysome shell carbonic anhydrase